MVVDDSDLSYWLNDTYLGVAFIDSRLKQGAPRPYVWLGNRGDKVEVLPGTVTE